MEQSLLKFIEKRTNKAIGDGLLFGKLSFEMVILNGRITEIRERPEANFKVEEIQQLIKV